MFGSVSLQATRTGPRFAAWGVLVLVSLGGSQAADPELLSPLAAVVDLGTDLGQRTLLVCAEGGQKSELVEKPLAYAYDNPSAPNEQYINPSGITNELKYRQPGLGVDGLKGDRWYGVSALYNYPSNQDPDNLKRLKRAAKTLGCVVKTTGAKVASGDLVRYRRLIDSANRIGLYNLLDGPDRYWPGLYAETTGEGYYRARLKVFDTLEKRWSAPETLGTEVEPLDDYAFYPIGRGLQLLYMIRIEIVRKPGYKPVRRHISHVRTFRPATGEFRTALATQWTLGMHLFDLNGDGFYEYCSTDGDELSKKFVPRHFGLVWRDSLQGYVNIKPKPPVEDE
ncbi:MAG TPA: hypothetical protein PKO15_16945 [Fibrobacteria bacterium]|nr:hypothetical protein [Fibrobacteria bacterium]HOX50836.1 hypothetical protein [Fibrobacteria bacterium]